MQQSNKKSPELWEIFYTLSELIGSIEIVAEESERCTSWWEYEHVSRNSLRIQPLHTIWKYIRCEILDVFLFCNSDKSLLRCSDTDHCLHSFLKFWCEMYELISLVRTPDDEKEIFWLSIGSECSLEALRARGLRILDEYDVIFFSHLLESVWEPIYLREVCPHTLGTDSYLSCDNSNREDIHCIMMSWEVSIREFVFFSPWDDDILTIGSIFFFCHFERVHLILWWTTRNLFPREYTGIFRYSYTKPLFTSELYYLRVHHSPLRGPLHDMHLGIEVLLHISVPVLMIYLEVGKYSIVRLEFSENMTHKTRHLEDDISLLFSLFEYIENRTRKRYIKIPWKVDWFFDRILFFEYIIHNPARCGLAICTSDGYNLETLWHISISEVEFWNHLARLVDGMCPRNSRWWYNHLIGVIGCWSICIITEFILHAKICRKFCNCRTNLSFTVY